MFENFVDAANVLALSTLALLILVNLVIIAARLSNHRQVADRMIRWLMPITNMFRIGAFKANSHHGNANGHAT